MNNKKVNILLIEDDINFRNAVSNIVTKSNSSPFFIKNFAVNGNEAISLLKSSNKEFDLILTDISMPILNGVELVKFVSSNYPHLPVICLSAYDDFDLVKEALLFGAKDYILKTNITPNNLIEKLNCSWTKIEQTRIENRLSRQIATAYSSESSEEFLSLQNNFESLNIQNFLVIRHKSRNISPLIEFFNSKQLKYINMLFSNDSGLIIIYNLSSLKSITALLTQKSYYSSSSLYCISDFSHDIFNLEKIFLQVKDMHNYFTLYNFKGIFTYNQYSEIISNADFKYISILKDNKINSETSLMELFDKLENLINKSKPEIKILNKAYIDMVIFFTKENEIKLSQNDYFVFIDTLQKQSSIDLKSNYTKLYLSNLINNSYIFKNQRLFSNEISQIIDYILLNYGSEITLTSLAETVNFNENYLSNLFKHETGENLTYFINKVRVHHAKILLKTTNFKAYEIAEKVGFNNASYFSTVFKKMENISLSDFKKTK